MPINKYDQAAQAQFINTYVPIPFEEMVMAGKQKQDRYDRAATAVDSAIAAAEEITAIPFSADELRAKEYVAKMRDIRDKYATRDISDPFVLREMSNELHRSVNKEDIKHIQQSYQGYLSYQKQLAANEQRGVPTPDWARQRFEGYDSSSPQGVFTGNAPAQLDPYKDTSDFMKQMGMTRKADVDLAPGVRAIKYSKDASEITQHAKDNLEAFMMLPSIQQYIAGIKANGAAGDRTDAQIALDFVEKNKRQWQEERLDPYNYDPSLVGGGPGNNPNPLQEPEIVVPKGVPASTKGVKERKIAQKIEELSTLEAAGDQDASNQLQEIGKKFEEAVKPFESQERIITSSADSAFNAAFNMLKSNGMDSNQAFDYLVNNADATQPQSTFKYTKGRWDNFLQKNENRSLDVEKQSMLNRITLASAFPRKEDAQAKKEYVTAVETYFDNLKSKGKSNEQVLVDYADITRQLDQQMKKLEKEKDKAKVDAYNKMLPYQETYTAVNGMFRRGDDGVIEGTYFDDKGSPKKYPSYIGRQVGDMLFNQKNYATKFYDEEGKELTRAKKYDLNSILKGETKNFMITGIDNKPTESGNAKVTVHMMDKDNNPVGDKFQVELPLRQGDNMENFVRELTGRDQNRTVFNQLNYGVVESLVKSTNVYNGGDIKLSSLGHEDATPEDRISFEPSGSGLIPILHFNGAEYKLSETPVSYRNLPSFLTGYLQSVKMD